MALVLEITEASHQESSNISQLFRNSYIQKNLPEK